MKTIRHFAQRDLACVTVSSIASEERCVLCLFLERDAETVQAYGKYTTFYFLRFKLQSFRFEFQFLSDCLWDQSFNN